MPIRQLPQDVINKIAAGEVVERPASVIKELVENAIDAGATSIRVAVYGGGQKSIEIEDNGSGMSRDDAQLSIQRHATSKISTDKDLFNLSTLGFRGEALAAISEVSRFTLATRREADDIGTIIEYFSDRVQIKAGAAQRGTRIVIEDLFYNVPARKKFMKSAQTETKHNTNLITQFALLYKDIEFRYESEGRLAIHFQAQDEWEKRVHDVLGEDVGNHLVSVGHENVDFQVAGFIAKPRIHRPNRGAQYIFVNGRCVTDHVIAAAVKDAFRNYIPPKDYPAFVLKLQVPSDFVDVNVHPRKSEVKFSESQIIYRMVYAAAKKVLQSELDGYSFTDSKEPSLAINQPSSSQSFTFSQQPGTQKISIPSQKVSGMSSFLRTETIQQEHAEESMRDEWRLMGQVNDSFLIGYSKDKFFVIDQHAGAERVIFDRIMQSKEAPKTQNLLLPISLELSGSEVELLAENLDTLAKLGFQIEVFGMNTFIIQGIPSQIRDHDIQDVMMGILDDLGSSEFAGLHSFEEKCEVAAKYTACRSAVKFGDRLSMEEQQQLLRDIQKYNVVSCPHGRPAVWQLTWEELARKFQRP